MITRKDFLLTLPAAVLVPGAIASAEEAGTKPAAPTATPAPTAKPVAKELKLPPVQPGPPYLLGGPQLGHVSHEEAKLWIRATAAAPWKVIVAEEANPGETREIKGPALEESHGFTAVATLAKLKPATRYVYEVVLGDRLQTAGRRPVFTTAPAPGTAGKLRIVLGSCVGETIAAAAGTWSELAARREMAPEQGAF